MKHKVLFVDDEKNILTTLKIQLKNCDFEPIFALGAFEAFKVLEKEKISIVVSDLKMPEMDGIELLTKVRQIVPDIVRIVLSSFSDKKHILDSINKGYVYRYIIKPWDIEELIIVVNQALDYYSIVDERKLLLKQLAEQNSLLENQNFILETGIAIRDQRISEQQSKLEKIGNKLSDLKILIITDDTNLTNLLSSNLNEAGYEKTIVTNLGEEALKFFWGNNFDVVFIDIPIRTINENKTFYALKKIDNKVPIVLIMEELEQTDKQTIKEIGAYDLIRKPFHIDEVFDIIERINEKIR